MCQMPQSTLLPKCSKLHAFALLLCEWFCIGRFCSDMCTVYISSIALPQYFVSLTHVRYPCLPECWVSVIFCVPDTWARCPGYPVCKCPQYFVSLTSCHWHACQLAPLPPPPSCPNARAVRGISALRVTALSVSVTMRSYCNSVTMSLKCNTWRYNPCMGGVGHKVAHHTTFRKFLELELNCLLNCMFQWQFCDNEKHAWEGLATRWHHTA